MDNAPKHTGYNTEMQRLARLERREVQTTDPYSPWKNKAEIFIKIIKVKAYRIRVQSNISKSVWVFVMVWEAEIYSHIADKGGLTAL